MCLGWRSSSGGAQGGPKWHVFESLGTSMRSTLKPPSKTHESLFTTGIGDVSDMASESHFYPSVVSYPSRTEKVVLWDQKPCRNGCFLAFRMSIRNHSYEFPEKPVTIGIEGIYIYCCWSHFLLSLVSGYSGSEIVKWNPINALIWYGLEVLWEDSKNISKMTI